MDVQTDINWIISELHQVKDPYLIEAFKNMLKYRHHQRSETATSLTDYNAELAAAESRINAGQYLTQDEVEKELD